MPTKIIEITIDKPEELYSIPYHNSGFNHQEADAYTKIDYNGCGEVDVNHENFFVDVYPGDTIQWRIFTTDSDYKVWIKDINFTGTGEMGPFGLNGHGTLSSGYDGEVRFMEGIVKDNNSILDYKYDILFYIENAKAEIKQKMFKVDPKLCIKSTN